MIVSKPLKVLVYWARWTRSMFCRRHFSNTFSWTKFSWWRHQMETFSALLTLCEGLVVTPVTGGFPSQRPVTRGYDVSLICAWTNGWANNRNAGYLRHHCAFYAVTVMLIRVASDGPAGSMSALVQVNGLAPNWRQGITYTNEKSLRKCISVSPDLSELLYILCMYTDALVVLGRMPGTLLTMLQRGLVWPH